MDIKELLAIVNSYGFEAKELYRYDIFPADGYELAIQGIDVIEVGEGITLVDYRGEYSCLTKFALFIKEGDGYAFYIDEADKDAI